MLGSFFFFFCLWPKIPLRGTKLLLSQRRLQVKSLFKALCIPLNALASHAKLWTLFPARKKFPIRFFFCFFFAARGKVRAVMHRCPYLHWQESIAAHILPWKLIICLQDVPLLLLQWKWKCNLGSFVTCTCSSICIFSIWRAEMAGKGICWFRAILTKRFKGIFPSEILTWGFPF